jgi:hypothetical protein
MYSGRLESLNGVTRQLAAAPTSASAPAPAPALRLALHKAALRTVATAALTSGSSPLLCATRPHLLVLRSPSIDRCLLPLTDQSGITVSRPAAWALETTMGLTTTTLYLCICIALAAVVYDQLTKRIPSRLRAEEAPRSAFGFVRADKFSPHDKPARAHGIEQV